MPQVTFIKKNKPKNIKASQVTFNQILKKKRK